MSIDRLAPKIGAILESSPVQKSMIIPYFILFVFSQYLFFDIYWMVNPSPYINLQIVEKAIPVKIVCIMITFIMLALKNKLETSRLAQQLTPYFFTSFYLISLMCMGYLIGHLSLIAGMVMAAELSHRLGMLDAAFVDRLKALIQRAGLPIKGPVIDTKDNAGRYLELMRIDKKSEAGEIRFVLIDGPGKAVIRPAPDALVREVIDACCA